METERLLIRRFKPDDWQDTFEYGILASEWFSRTL